MTVYVIDRQEIVDILRQPETFQGLQLPVLDDDETGATVRRKLHRALSPHVLARFEPALRTQAAALIESVAAQGYCDAIADVAIPFVVRSMLCFLGLPRTEFNRVLGLTYRHLVSPGDRESQVAEDRIRLRYLAYALKVSPPQGIRESLATGDDALSDAQVLSVCDVLLPNGTISTAAAIGNCLYRLAGNWGVPHGLRLAPNLIKPFV